MYGSLSCFFRFFFVRFSIIVHRVSRPNKKLLVFLSFSLSLSLSRSFHLNLTSHSLTFYLLFNGNPGSPKNTQQVNTVFGPPDSEFSYNIYFHFSVERLEPFHSPIPRLPLSSHSFEYFAQDGLSKLWFNWTELMYEISVYLSVAFSKQHVTILFILEHLENKPGAISKKRVPDRRRALPLINRNQGRSAVTGEASASLVPPPLNVFHFRLLTSGKPHTSRCHSSSSFNHPHDTIQRG